MCVCPGSRAAVRDVCVALCGCSGSVCVDQEGAAEGPEGAGGELTRCCSRECWLGHRLTSPSSTQLGAGVSLPGVLAAACSVCVTLTDVPSCLESCRRSCDANSLQHVPVVGVTWGEVSPELVTLPPLDIILGSDVFYDPPGGFSGAALPARCKGRK